MAGKKKQIRKTKEKLVGLANEIRAQSQDPDVPKGAAKLLDEAHTEVLEGVNKMVDALNFTPKV